MIYFLPVNSRFNFSDSVYIYNTIKKLKYPIVVVFNVKNLCSINMFLNK